MFAFAKSLVQSVTGVASEDFNEWISARCSDQEHAPFYEGSFYEAVEAAADRAGKTEGRGLALLWLHEREDDNTTRLCTEVWTHAGVQAELRSRFVGWAGDIYRYEGNSLARGLRIRNFPALVAVQRVPGGTANAVEWPRGNYFRVLLIATGRVAGDGLHAALLELADSLDAARRQENEWRENMRQMQEMSRNILQGMADVQAEARRQAERARKLQNAEDDERACFAAIFESRYGAEPPPFFEGSFEEALASARSEKRLLLVWLYGDTEVDDALCREVFTSETQVFNAFVREYFVMWPGDGNHWLRPVQLREMLRTPALPVLLVLQPLNVYEAQILPWSDPSAGSPVEFPADSAWSLLGSWNVAQAGTAEDEIMAFLAEHGDRAVQEEKKREEERQLARERAAEARALREAQDLEFEESLRADSDRVAAAAADSPGLRQDGGAPATVQPTAAEIAALKAKRAKDEAKAAEKAALSQSRREAAEKMLGVPPPAGVCCELVLRLPNGRRAARKFSAEEKLVEVYSWASCSGELCSLEGGESFEVPRKFSLATTYPRAVLRNPEDPCREHQQNFT